GPPEPAVSPPPCGRAGRAALDTVTATRTGVAGSFLLVAAFTATFEKLHPGNAGAVTFAHAAALGFVLGVALERLGARDWRISPAAAAVCGFLVAFELVWLVGFFNLDTARAVVQWQKGLAVGTLHLVFAAAAVAYVARRSPRFYRRLAAAFVLGLAANGVYAVAQLLAAHGGHNLDAAVLGPLTGRVRPINTYGVVGGVTIYRPNGLTEDPNHLGVMTAAAVLLVTPIYLRLRTRSGRLTLGALLVFFLIAE